jgi:hypothetical protein
VNPDLRFDDVRLRLYNSIGYTPYSGRKIYIKAVQFSEIQYWTKGFKRVSLTFTKIAQKTGAALACVAHAGIRDLPSRVPTLYKASLTFFGDNVDL